MAIFLFYLFTCLFIINFMYVYMIDWLIDFYGPTEAHRGSRARNWIWAWTTAAVTLDSLTHCLLARDGTCASSVTWAATVRFLTHCATKELLSLLKSLCFLEMEPSPQVTNSLWLCSHISIDRPSFLRAIILSEDRGKSLSKSKFSLKTRGIQIHMRWH